MSVIAGQFGFGSLFTLAYLVSPKFCHRVVGYVEDYKNVLADIEKLKDQTKENKAKAKDQNIIQYLQTLQQMMSASKDFDSLVAKRDAYDRALPPLSSPKADNGVLMAPNGSLVIKGKKSVLLEEEYLILGTFTTAAVSAK